MKTLGFYDQLTLGESIPPHNPFAVSVHLPTIDFVRAYEENLNNWRLCLRSGYPRFFENQFELRIKKKISTLFNLKANCIELLDNPTVAKHIKVFFA